MDECLTDPVCADCGGPMSIVERSAEFMIAVCADCGASQGIEVTTYRDGRTVYWPSFRISLKGDVSE